MARSISILLAARISSFLSVNNSANWQIISPLWKCSQNEQVTTIHKRSVSHWFKLNNSVDWAHYLAWVQRGKSPSAAPCHFCLLLHSGTWWSDITDFNEDTGNTGTSITFHIYSPAGLISVKKVPTFLPSTMSVMTWPVTLGWVPFAMTTEVPLCKAQTAAFTYNRTSLLEEKQYFIYVTLQICKIRVWFRDFSKNKYQMAWTLHSAWSIHLFYQTTYTTNCSLNNWKKITWTLTKESSLNLLWPPFPQDQLWTLCQKWWTAGPQGRRCQSTWHRLFLEGCHRGLKDQTIPKLTDLLVDCSWLLCIKSPSNS